MKNGESIVIEKVSNGILVRSSFSGGRREDLITNDDIAVFNAVGHAVSSSVPTLTGFIAKHFGEEEKERQA